MRVIDSGVTVSRWAWRVVLVLLLGVLFTWGNAWYLALFPKKTWGGYFQQTIRGWYLDKQGRRVPFEFTSGGASPGYCDFSRGNRDVYEAFFHALSTIPTLVFKMEAWDDYAFGIPFRSMGYRVIDVTRRREGQSEQARSGWPVEQVKAEWPGAVMIKSSTAKRWGYPWGPPGGWVFLPGRVQWPGFVLDSLFYALALFLLIWGPSIGRRWLRSRRFQCVGCGYELRGLSSNRCPECGMAVPEHRVAAINALPLDRVMPQPSRAARMLLVVAGALLLALLVSLRFCIYAAVPGCGLQIHEGSVRLLFGSRIPLTAPGIEVDKLRHFPILPWLYTISGAPWHTVLVVPLAPLILLLGITAAWLYRKKRGEVR